MKRITILLTAGGFLFVMFGFSATFFLCGAHTFSERENRSLQTLPKLTFSKLIDGSYAEEINDYFSDQFPMRDVFVGWKGISELLLGKGENNGVLLGSDGYLAKRLFAIRSADGTVTEEMDAFDKSQIRAVGEGIRELSNNLNIPLSVMPVGRNVDVCSSAFFYPDCYSDVLLSTLRDELEPYVSYLDLVTDFRSRFDAGEYVYYKTDHHWTTYGAYLAYCEIMRSFGMEEVIKSMDFFEKRTVSDSFYGSLWSKGGMDFISPDCVEIWYGTDETDYEVRADGRLLDGFYQLESLEHRDHYSVFLDGTHDIVTVKKANEKDRPVLLIPKDSYANSLAPFLARHFDLVLCNLSSKNDYTDVSALAREYDADRVLIVYGIENIMTADKLCRLK